jgi:decaprenylphospho-beta-D-ribofuranose 2-oxidase
MSSQFDLGMKRPLSGWGRYPVQNCAVQRPENISSLLQLTQTPEVKSLLSRGAGRSYGDAAFNSVGYTILGERLNRMLDFNERTGLLCCEAGVTIEDILKVFLPRGWFPIVTPGTKFVTVGGAVAFDVHGKNHHRDSSFCRYVRRLTLILASGETVSCSREENSDLFWATVGGMGLTGIIVDVELFLRPSATAYYKTLNLKARDLLEALALFDEHEPHYQYSVAWIDCLASGNALGRSLLTLGNEATLEDLNRRQRVHPLEISPRRRWRVPFDFPSGALNRYTVGMFNQLYYHRQRSPQVEKIVDYDSFFYPLDAIGDWNRIYGKRGFVQYQFVIPNSVSREGLTCVLKLLSSKGCGSFLAVLKRFGAQDGGWLSFPMPGYTLALDIPIQTGIWEFLEQLDRIVLEYGGRLYLAKDARLRPEVFRQMYPNYDRWLRVKSQVDPQNRFQSALSERLHIEPVREALTV